MNNNSASKRNLTAFNENGLELFIDTATGEVFASQRAVARMCGRDESTIRAFIGAGKISVETTEIHTNGGKQGAKLLNEKAIGSAIIKYNTELLAQCFSAGLRVYLHGLAGYRYQVAEAPPHREKKLNSWQEYAINYPPIGLFKADDTESALEKVRDAIAILITWEAGAKYLGMWRELALIRSVYSKVSAAELLLHAQFVD